MTLNPWAGRLKNTTSVWKGPITYPPDHKVGMVVPLGGSDCAKCSYASGQKCRNDIFVKWNGSQTIPAPTNRYCCDLFESKK